MSYCRHTHCQLIVNVLYASHRSVSLVALIRTSLHTGPALAAMDGMSLSAQIRLRAKEVIRGGTYIVRFE